MKSSSYTFRYCSIQALYWGAYCALMGFGSVYLLGQGFSNSVIGVVFALTNVIGIITQPAIGSFADSHPKLELRTIINAILAGAIVLSIAIFFMRGTSALLLCVFIGIVTCMLTIQPLLSSLAFVFEKYGISINFGMARGMGSVAYALVSIAVGYIVEAFGFTIIPIIYLILNMICVLIVYSLATPKREVKEEKKEEVKQLSFIEFFKKYKRFTIFALGAVAVYFTHTVINNFFIQIITPIGGTTSQMGIAVFIAAMVELPAMSMFEKLCDKVGCSTLLKFATVMFIAKHLLTYLAPNMTILYMVQVLQMFSWAIFQPGLVYYANKVVDARDMNKGQSLMTMSFVGSGIIGNLAGGILLDAFSVSTVLLIGVMMSVLGAIVTFASIENK